MSEVTQTGSVVTNAGSSAAPTQDWRTGIPEDLRSDPSLADIKDVGNLAKSYVNSQKLIGKNRISLPGEDATDQEWGQFYNSLGRPEQPDAYNFGERPVMPEGVQYDEQFEGTFKNLAHTAGLTPKQAKQIYDGYHEYVGNKLTSEGQTSEAQASQWVDSLKQEFGKAYDERVDLAQRAVETYGSPELTEWLDNTGMGNNPMIVKMFAKIGENLAEGRPDISSQRSFTMTPDQARQEISRYNRDSDFMNAYNSGDHAGHAQAVQKMNNLFQLAYPDDNPIA